MNRLTCDCRFCSHMSDGTLGSVWQRMQAWARGGLPARCTAPPRASDNPNSRAYVPEWAEPLERRQ
jgi:hypothetical protein